MYVDSFKRYCSEKVSQTDRQIDRHSWQQCPYSCMAGSLVEVKHQQPTDTGPKLHVGLDCMRPICENMHYHFCGNILDIYGMGQFFHPLWQQLTYLQTSVLHINTLPAISVQLMVIVLPTIIMNVHLHWPFLARQAIFLRTSATSGQWQHVGIDHVTPVQRRFSDDILQGS